MTGNKQTAFQLTAIKKKILFKKRTKRQRLEYSAQLDRRRVTPQKGTITINDQLISALNVADRDRFRVIKFIVTHLQME